MHTYRSLARSFQCGRFRMRNHNIDFDFIGNALEKYSSHEGKRCTNVKVKEAQSGPARQGEKECGESNIYTRIIRLYNQVLSLRNSSVEFVALELDVRSSARARLERI